MPIKVAESINSAFSRIAGIPLVNRIAKNPVYSALTITFIIVLIIMFIFRDAETEDSLLIMCLRSGFYISLLMVSFMFLHNKLLLAEVVSGEKSQVLDQVFKTGQYEPGEITSDIIPVNINYDLDYLEP